MANPLQLDAVTQVAGPALRPSEYTAALIQALRQDAGRIDGADVLEIGPGSGVVLAALAAHGAGSLCGVDVEEDAVATTTALLEDLGHGPRSRIHRGDMWTPLDGRRFDLIVANLPHFAMSDHEFPGRHATWSSGGPDGRRSLDRFLDGLSDHLSAGGYALMTHNGFVGLDTTREKLAGQGLEMRVVLSTLVHIGTEKLCAMTPSVFREQEGRTVHMYGPYAFADMHVVEIAAPSRRSGSR